MAKISKDEVAFVVQQAKCDSHTAKVWLKAKKGNLGQAVIAARDDVEVTRLGKMGAPVTLAVLAGGTR